MKTSPILSSLVLAAAAIAPLRAALTFDTAADYTNNFTHVSSTNSTALAWDAGTLRQSGNSNGASIAYYDTPVASDDYSLQVDARFSANPILNQSANGVGLITHVGANSGYTTIFRINSTTTADMRVFEGGTYSTGSVGTQKFITTLTLTGGNTFSATGLQTYKLDVVNAGSSITFTGSIFTTGGTLLGTFNAFTDDSPTNVTSSTVGIRLGIEGFQQTRLDNFTLTTANIPEPSTYALLGGAAVLGLALTIRRRTR